MPVVLKEIIPWGRSFDEYRLIFDLSPDDLAGRTLGCGDGPASFNAEATALGHSVVSCDPVYTLSADEIDQRVRDRYDEVIAQVHKNPEEFLWDYFQDPDDLGRRRLGALQRFVGDFEAGKSEGRYVTAALPTLPFEEGQFDLALVSHVLFLYSEQLSFDLHVKAIEELLRVARQVRIFPLQTLARQVSPHLEPIRTHLAQKGCTSETRRVPYEFVRGSNQMLVIGRS